MYHLPFKLMKTIFALILLLFPALSFAHSYNCKTVSELSTLPFKMVTLRTIEEDGLKPELEIEFTVGIEQKILRGSLFKKTDFDEQLYSDFNHLSQGTYRLDITILTDPKLAIGQMKRFYLAQDEFVAESGFTQDASDYFTHRENAQFTCEPLIEPLLTTEIRSQK
jgi:hypothetical protein